MTDLKTTDTFPARLVIFAGKAARPSRKKLADFLGYFWLLTE